MGIGSPKTEVIDVCELPFWCWEQQIPLTAEPSLQPTKKNVKNTVYPSIIVISGIEFSVSGSLFFIHMCVRIYKFTYMGVKRQHVDSGVYGFLKLYNLCLYSQSHLTTHL